MSTPDLNRILRNDGGLVYNPTTFGANPVYPYGGKPLGMVRDFVVNWNIRSRRRRSPDMNRVVEIGLSGQECEVTFSIEQWDPDLLPLFHPRVVTSGSPSGIQDMARIEGAGQPRPLPAIEPLLFYPKDPTGIAVVFLRPAPDPATAQGVRFALDSDAVQIISFVATLNSNFNSLYVDKLEHLKLT